MVGVEKCIRISRLPLSLPLCFLSFLLFCMFSHYLIIPAAFTSEIKLGDVISLHADRYVFSSRIVSYKF